MSKGQVAYVLGGGGHNGAAEVGMLRALIERDIAPDMIFGTSVGALNGAAIAAAPTVETVETLERTWLTLDDDAIFGGSIFAGAANLFRSRTSMHSNASLRRLLADLLPKTFSELVVSFECVAACIERSSEHWFTDGSLHDAILASAAVPGVLPPVLVNGEHYIDGGVVNSIPLSRAVESGAKTIYVLQVGRVETPLTPPKTPVQVGLVAFEIARRHRFARDLAALPDDVTAHVLPTGAPKKPSVRQLNYRDFKAIKRRITRAYEATVVYLDDKGSA